MSFFFSNFETRYLPSFSQLKGALGLVGCSRLAAMARLHPNEMNRIASLVELKGEKYPVEVEVNQPIQNEDSEVAFDLQIKGCKQFFLQVFKDKLLSQLYEAHNRKRIIANA